LAAGLRAEPLWEIMHSPIPLLKEERGGEGGEGMRPTSKGREGREGREGPISKGDGREGREFCPGESR